VRMHGCTSTRKYNDSRSGEACLARQAPLVETISAYLKTS
jgi:hypothetical protein